MRFKNYYLNILSFLLYLILNIISTKIQKFVIIIFNYLITKADTFF